MNPTEAFDKEVSKNYRFNFTVNLADLAFYMFGYSFISPATILPVFVSHFTKNPILLGMIPFISTAGFLVPQLFSSNLIERAPVKKFYPFNLGLFLERLPVFLLIGVTFFFAGKNSAATLVLFFLLFAWHTSGAGFIMVGWQDMIAKIIPVDKRGRFFGVSNFVGNIAGIAGATAVAQMLVRFAFPTGYVLAFVCASICILISWFFLGMSREPRDPVSKPVISHREYFASLPQIIHSSPNFRNFLLTQIVSAFGAMAGGFIMVFALNRWDIPDGQAASYSIAMLLGQSVANLFLGFLADRKGHKIVLEISIVFNIATFLLALAAPTPQWFFVVFALRGISLAGNFVSSMSFPLEFSDPQDRPTFIGLAGTVPGIAGALAPILGGGLAAILGYNFLFTLSIGIAVVSLGCMHWWVREPRNSKSPARQIAQPGN
jgi:MFS family permease